MKKYFAFPIFYICVAIMLEVINFLMLGIGFLPEYFLFDFSIIIFLGATLFIIRNNLAQTITFTVLVILQMGIMVVNYTLFVQFGDIISLEMLNLIQAASKAMNSDFISIWAFVGVTLLLAALIVGAGLLYAHIRKMPANKNKRTAIGLAMIMVLVQVSGILGYGIQKNFIYAKSDISSTDYIESDRFLLDTTILKMKGMQKLGTFGFYVNNLVLNINGGKSFNTNINKATIDYVKSGEKSTPSSDFGVEAGNNLLMVMLESFEWYGLCEELTPNIMKVINDGQGVNSYFSKNKTNISEGVALTGYYPIQTNYQSLLGKGYDGEKGDLGLTLPNIMKGEGYSTQFFHSYSKDFYAREYMNINLGFDKAYFIEDAGVERPIFYHWMAEKDYVDIMIDKMIPSASDPFFTYYTTVGTHGNYYDSEFSMDQVLYKDFVANSKKYNQLVTERPGLGTEKYKYLRNYLAAVVGTDRAIGALIDELKAQNKYDDTTIVLFADHNAYYHELTYAMRDLPNTEYADLGVNSVPFIIKSHAKKNISNLKNIVSSQDILPTILDLIGIEYNTNLYLGTSMFADDFDSVVRTNFSHTGGVFGSKFYTFDLVDFEPYVEEYTKEELDDFKTSAEALLRKIYLLNYLYVHNLYPQTLNALI